MATLCYPVEYSPPGSSVHGIFQARILKWVAISTKWQATSVSPAFTITQIGEPNIHTLLSYLHSLFHPSAKVLKAFLQNFIELTKDNVTYLNNMTQICTICRRTNPNSNIRPAPFPNHQIRRHLPTHDWQVEFTHMPPVKRVKFLLVFVDTFSGWTEAFPTTNKWAPTVAGLILTEILPRFGMPSSLQSDNRPRFTSQITQNIALALQVPWRFHIPYHLQSSGKVERAKTNSDQINDRT